jgi:hypothetical protein
MRFSCAAIVPATAEPSRPTTKHAWDSGTIALADGEENPTVAQKKVIP